MCCFTSETCCQPYEEDEYNGPEQAWDPGVPIRKRGTLNGSEPITRPIKTIYKPASPENNPYAELFNQSTAKFDKLSSHDTMVICLTGGMITVALVAGVTLTCVAYRKATRAAEYHALQDPPSILPYRGALVEYCARPNSHHDQFSSAFTDGFPHDSESARFHHDGYIAELQANATAQAQPADSDMYLSHFDLGQMNTTSDSFDSKLCFLAPDTWPMAKIPWKGIFVSQQW